MRIDKRDLDAILQKADIVDVIGRYLPLEKKGKDYVTICPFHDDHDPSMRISPTKQIYKCFVCGAGGNVFTFFQKHEGLGFVQAVQRVAGLIGYPLHIEERPKAADNRQPWFDALRLFGAYCQYELFSQDGQQARAYLQQRKFEKSILDTYEIGYAPARSMVRQYLAARFEDRAALEQTGLIQIGKEDLVPVFHDRIVIPIHDPQGRPVGFTARILNKDPGQAKYINTTTTPLFDKSQLIYNYHRAAKACRKAGRVILCEGAMDVLGLAKAGMNEGIACLGTAMTDAQLALISRLNVPVVVFYDQDKAGRKAAFQFGQKALGSGLSFSFVQSDQAKDPDEIYIEQGAEALRNLVGHTISYAQFALDYLKTVYDLDNYEDKKKYALQMEQLVRATLAPFEQPALFDQLQKTTGFTFEPQSFFAPIRAKRQGGEPFSKKKWESRTRQKPEAAVSLPPVMQGRLQAEKAVLWAMMFHEAFLGKFQEEVGFFGNPACAQLALYIHQAYRKNRDIDPVGLLDVIEEPEVRSLLIELSEWPDYSDMLEEFFWDSVAKIQSDVLQAQIQDLTEKIRTCQDAGEKVRLAMEKTRLTSRRLGLNNRKEK